MGCERLEASLSQKKQASSISGLNLITSYSNTKSLYLGFVSGAGLFSATLGEEGSSGMADCGGVDEDAEEADAVCDFSDLSVLSDLEERFIKFKNPPLLFFFSAS